MENWPKAAVHSMVRRQRSPAFLILETAVLQRHLPSVRSDFNSDVWVKWPAPTAAAAAEARVLSKNVEVHV